MTKRRGLDAWLVDLTDAAVGWLQERGVPLPRVLADSGLAVVGTLAGVIGMRVINREWSMAAVEFICLGPWCIGFLSLRLDAYRSDESRMDARAVFERYTSNALQEREAHSVQRPICCLVSLWLMTMACVLTLNSTDIGFALAYLGFISHHYCLCAYPRFSRRAKAKSRDLALRSAA